jgi:phage baseplate assembly protein W
MANDSLVPFEKRSVGATWLDVNTRVGNGLPILVPDRLAIRNSLQNLFACPIGARGRIFQPKYGTLIYNLLHEPADNTTASKISASLIQAIARWEPRIRIDVHNTSVVYRQAIFGYVVTITYWEVLTSQQVREVFGVSTLN